jgi:Uma2 family endonuclease
MATAEQIQRVVSEHGPPESRLLLHAVDWRTYTALREPGSNNHVRMTYDRGDLEMMSPSRLHERLSYLIGRLIDIWTEVRGIDIGACRTMTFKRDDLERGLEPDNCYYVAHERVIREKVQVDLAVDPPPDLAIEIELTPAAVDRLSLYSAFGVPELWRFDGQTLYVYILGKDGCYQPCRYSACFPQLPPAEIERVLAQLGTASETTLVRAFRQWALSVAPQA